MPSVLRSIVHYRGALLIVFLQAAPVDIRERENGRFALALGFGGDNYTQERFACDGSTIESRTVSSRTVSGTVNVPLRGEWSLDGFGGSTSTDGPVCVDSGCALPPAFKGGFGGLRVRVEGDAAGFSIGFALLPDVDINQMDGTHRPTRAVEPTLTMRLGSADPGRKHFLVNVNGVPVPGSVPFTTFGMGFSSAEANPVRGFVGLAIPPYSVAENGSLLLRGEMLVPVGRHLSLNFGAGANGSILTGSGGLRLQLGRASPAP